MTAPASLSSSIQVNKATERYPGLILESPLQACAYLEDFEAGAKIFERLDQPASADHRWLGVCLFKLFQDSEAELAFRRALRGGHEGARINLAHLIGFRDIRRAQQELSNVDASRLSRSDQVLLHRVSSFLAEAEGNLREALYEAELAWKALQGLPEFSLLAPGIFNQLGVLYGRTGREQRALWFIDNALKITEGIEAQKTKLRRAYVLSEMGRLQEAQNELQEFRESSPNLLVEMKRVLGDIAWRSGKLNDAKGLFHSADQLAANEGLHGNVFDRFVCNLSLATIEAHHKEFALATHYLTQAQNFTTDRTDRLLFRFREILVRFWADEYSADHALSELHFLADNFKSLGLMKEQGAVILHAAAVGDAMNQSVATELELLETLAITLQSSRFVAREWPLLPSLKRKLAVSGHLLAPVEPSTIRIESLKKPKLFVNGTEIDKVSGLSIELLAYFLEVRAAPFDQIAHDMFAANPEGSAERLFHQLRDEIENTLPEVSIKYDQETNVFHLESSSSILWDFAEIRAAGRGSVDWSIVPFADSTSTWTQRLHQRHNDVERG